MTIQPSGIANNKISGRMSRFTIPSTNAAAVATTNTDVPPTGLMLIPETIQAVISKEIVSTNQTTKNRIIMRIRCAIVLIPWSPLSV
jgi:hypothetical protein